MSQTVAKRVSTSSINWAKLSDRLTSQHSAELSRLKGQNSTYSGQVNQLPADLPKVDFAELKKKLPAQAAIIDSLQKQYESVKIPYGNVPEDKSKEIGKWEQFNEIRTKFFELKAADGADEVKKVEDKWANAPPIEQLRQEHFPKYFGQLYEYYDLRYQNRIPDPVRMGVNTPEMYEEMYIRFKDYKILRRPGKVDDH